MTEWRIGVDLGGTKTEVVLLRGDSQEHFRTRVATPKNDYRGTLRTIVDLVNQAEAVAGQSSLPVGLGIPGSVSRLTGRVKNANSTWLNGQSLPQDMQGLLGRAVKVTNDANCLALSEAIDGAGQNFELVFAAILGTGCGAGIAFRGAPLVGPNGLAGEWGHNPLPWTPDAQLQARPCYCGRFGCQETFLSGTGLALSYFQSTGDQVTGEQLLGLARAGEAPAVNVFNQYLERLTKGLAGVINVLDPDVIVLGGGISNVPEVYERVPELLPQYVFGGECDTPIVRARHGDSSGVRGAAWLNPLSGA